MAANCGLRAAIAAVRGQDENRTVLSKLTLQMRVHFHRFSLAQSRQQSYAGLQSMFSMAGIAYIKKQKKQYKTILSCV